MHIFFCISYGCVLNYSELLFSYHGRPLRPWAYICPSNG